MLQNIDQLFARVFNTSSGKELMAYLRSITLERVLSADASDAAIRFLEGQRFLVRQMENFTQRGSVAYSTMEKGETDG